MSIRNPLLDKYSNKSLGVKPTVKLGNVASSSNQLQHLKTLSSSSFSTKLSSSLKPTPSLHLSHLTKKSVQTSSRLLGSSNTTKSTDLINKCLITSNTTSLVTEKSEEKSASEEISSTTEDSVHFKDLAPLDKLPFLTSGETLNNYFESQPHKDTAYSEEELLKQDFINLAACSLIEQPKFDDRHDPTRVKVIELSEKVIKFDPEFILKVALFTRRQLNIRVTANFLVALAAFKKDCRRYIKKYYNEIVRLPSDWIDIAELYTSMGDKTINYSAIPACLRKAMVKKFPSFDEYQIGKYNKKPKKKDDEELDEEEKYYERHHFTLKQLIRKVHIFEPPNIIMPILGKKYPSTQEEFYRSKLPGHWDETLSGKRMKIPTPFTWETQLSANGNNSKTWKDLILSKKLPYMAMLRNLRNIILSGVKDNIHKIVQKKISSVEDVKRSKQFPFRFLSAYAVLDNLETTATEIAWSTTPNFEENKLVSQYKKCLDKAVQISAIHNVKPIKGSVLILFCCDMLMDVSCSTKGLGMVRTLREVAGLMSLMIMFSSEYSKLVYYTSERVEAGKKLDTGGEILKFLPKFVEESTKEGEEMSEEISLDVYMTRLTEKEVHYDTIIQISHSDRDLANVIGMYREKVNLNLLYVNITLQAKGAGFVDAYGSHRNDVYLSGFSDQMLQYISERGSGELLSTVESIDKKFKLLPLAKPMAHHYISPLAKQVNSKVLKVFISSTFTDLEMERRVITLEVMQHVNEHLKDKYFVVQEIDLRWGITEAESKSNQVVGRCLDELQKCDYFICIIGERYGTVVDSLPLINDDHEWINNHVPGCSITELEIRAAIFQGYIPVANCALLVKTDAEGKNLCDNDPRLAKIYNKVTHVVGITVKHYINGKFRDDFGRYAENILLDFVKNREEDQKDVSLDDLHRSYIIKQCSTFVSRGNLLSNLCDSISKHSMVLVTGPEGTGKSSLLARAIASIPDNKRQNAFYHVVKLNSESRSLYHLLNRLCYHLSKVINEPLDDQFEPISTLWGQLRKCETEFYIIIDGLDELTTSQDNFAWLPDELPRCITLVVSASQSSQWYTYLNKKYPKLYIFPVSKLSVAEKVEVAKQMLWSYGKRLEEKGFNSQLNIFLSKRDATSPLFIDLSIQELRLNAIFENLTDCISELPQTTEALYCKTLETARKVSTHCETLLQMLWCSQSGLSEADLLAFLQVKPMLLYTLLHHLQLFISTDKHRGILTLKNNYARKIVRQKCFLNKEVFMVHNDLGIAFLDTIEHHSCYYHSTRRDAFQNVIFHFAQAGSWDFLSVFLIDVNFVRQCVYLRLLDEVLAALSFDGSTLKGKAKNDFRWMENENIEFMKQFLVNNRTILTREPLLFKQQLLLTTYEFKRNAEFNNTVGCFKSLNPEQVVYTCQVNNHCKSEVTCVSASTDAPLIVIGYKDSKLQLFDSNTSRVLFTYRGHTGPVTCCGFLTSARFVSGGSDGCLKLWSVSDPVCVTSIAPHVHPIQAIDINVLSKCVVSVGIDRRATVWHNDIIFDTIELENPMNCVCFIEMGKKFVAGAWNGDLYVYDLVQKIKISPKKRGKVHKNSIRALASGNKQFAALDVTGILSLWDQATLDVLRCVGVGSAVTLSFDFEDRLLFGYGNGAITISSGFGALSTFNDKGTSAVTTITINGDNEIYVGYYSGEVVAIHSGEMIATHKGKVNQIAVTPNTVISCSDDGTLLVSDKGGDWGGSTHIQLSHVGKILSVCEADGVIYTGGQDCTIIAQQISEGNEAKLFGHEGAVTTLIAMDKDKLVSGGQDNAVKLWNRRTGKCLFTADSKHSDWVTCGARHPKLDRVFVTGSRDNTVIVWRLESSRIYPKYTLVGLYSPVTSVDLLAGDDNEVHMIMGADQSGNVVMWNGEGKYISCTRPSSSGVGYCIFQPNSTDYPIAYVGTNDGEIKKICTSELDILASFTHHTKAVKAISPLLNQSFVSISLDYTLQKWDWCDSPPAEAIVDSILDIRWCPISREEFRVAVLNRDGTLSQYTVVDGEISLDFKKNHPNLRNCFGIIPPTKTSNAAVFESLSSSTTKIICSSNKLIEIGDTNSITVYPIADGLVDEETVTKQEIIGGPSMRTCIDVTRKGILMYGNHGNVSHFLNLKTGKKMPSVFTKMEDMVKTKITCVAYYNGQAVVGTNIGTICLTTKEGKYNQKKHEVKFFSSAVTMLQCITDVNGDTVIFAGSKDGVLKVLTHELNVIGVFYTNGGVTTLQVLQEHEHASTGEIFLVVGDKCGKIHFLKWLPPEENTAMAD